MSQGKQPSWTGSRATQPARHRSHGARAFGDYQMAVAELEAVIGADVYSATRSHRKEGTLDENVYSKESQCCSCSLRCFLARLSCGKKAPSGEPSNIDYWTCTMHPSVKRRSEPGKCPICSMDLVPVMKESATPAELQLKAPRST